MAGEVSEGRPCEREHVNTERGFRELWTHSSGEKVVFLDDSEHSETVTDPAVSA
jgi:hypothetical protein